MADEAETIRKQLEKILGGEIGGGARTIPGTVDVSGREFRYVSCSPRLSNKQLGDLFDRVTRLVTPPLLQGDGTAVSENAELTLPSGECFFALSYNGDMDGWRKQIEQGAKLLGLQVATVVRDNLKVEDGREIKLSECVVRFF